MPITAADLEEEFQEEQANKAKAKAEAERSTDAEKIARSCWRLLAAGLTCAVVLLFVLPNTSATSQLSVSTFQGDTSTTSLEPLSVMTPKTSLQRDPLQLLPSASPDLSLQVASISQPSMNQTLSASVQASSRPQASLNTIFQNTSSETAKQLDQLQLAVPRNASFQNTPLQTSKTVEWSFSYHPFNETSGDLQCPTRCDPNDTGTCARCIRIGNDPLRHTRIFDVSNVYYYDGPWFYDSNYGSAQAEINRCALTCYPTWYAEDSSREIRPETYFRPRDDEEREISCTRVKMDPVLLVRWWTPNWTVNPYHFYMETVFSTFMAAAYIAKLLGCPTKKIQIYLIHGLIMPHTVGKKNYEKWLKKFPVFPDLWKHFFGQWLGDYNKMKGCYKRVFYGQSLKNMIRLNLRGTAYDASLSSWMLAYRLNLRAGLVPSEVLNTTLRDPAARPMLLVSHRRAPDWFQKLDWSVPGFKIEGIAFEDLSYTEQVSKVAVSRGLLGVAGSGLSHQLFLPVRSLIGYVALFEGSSWELQGLGCCFTRMDRENPGDLQKEHNTLHYMNTALNAGNTAVMWRWCRPDIFSDSAGFQSEHAQAVLKLLLHLDAEERSTVHGCQVLDGNLSSPGWPRCDREMVVPTPTATERCEAYGHVGLPYNSEDGSSFTLTETRLKYQGYFGGQDPRQYNQIKEGVDFIACR